MSRESHGVAPRHVARRESHKVRCDGRARYQLRWSVFSLAHINISELLAKFFGTCPGNPRWVHPATALPELMFFAVARRLAFTADPRNVSSKTMSR